MNDGTKLTGWMFTDATRQVECPRCKAAPMENCRTPAGRKTTTPHDERTDALIKKVGIEPYKHHA